MGRPKKKRKIYHCIHCGSIKTIRLEYEAKHAATDRVLVHCPDCRKTFTVFLPHEPIPSLIPQSGKPIYILDACDCSTRLTIRALLQTSQTDSAIYFTDVCLACGNTVKICQPLDDIEDILEVKHDFDVFIESYESWGLMDYLIR